MKKPENPFRILWNRAYDYFTASLARKVFFFAAVVVLVLALVIRFFQDVEALSFLLLSSAVVCVGATLVDSLQSRRVFVAQFKGLEADFVRRAAEKQGADGGEPSQKGAFSPEEISFMKKKKREYNYSILVKGILLIILLALFISLV